LSTNCCEASQEELGWGNDDVHRRSWDGAMMMFSVPPRIVGSGWMERERELAQNL